MILEANNRESIELMIILITTTKPIRGSYSSYYKNQVEIPVQVLRRFPYTAYENNDQTRDKTMQEIYHDYLS